MFHQDRDGNLRSFCWGKAGEPGMIPILIWNLFFLEVFILFESNYLSGSCLASNGNARNVVVSDQLDPM